MDRGWGFCYKYPTHKTASHTHTRKHPAPNLNSAEVEKRWTIGVPQITEAVESSGKSMDCLPKARTQVPARPV